MNGILAQVKKPVIWHNSILFLSIFSGDFFLAVSFLTSGENYKAYDLFLETAKGVFTDTFLQQRILKHETDDQNKAYANYYLKVELL